MKRSKEEQTEKGPIVSFVGAGPGDPLLITVKGREILEAADVIIYAGSLVNPALLEGLAAAVYDSARMNLDEIIAVMKEAVEKNMRVARLHTGDPAFYSAVSEQIERLRGLGIAYEVIPGVSSAMAGAALLGQELTIPEISQTVIFTRLEGRTPVPEGEALAGLARHKASMVIFLSAGMIEKVVEELLKGYPEDTPAVVIEKASWPDERVIRGSLRDIAARAAEAGVRKTALIYVGESLRASMGDLGKESRLYHKGFTHGYRK
ncbi:MAG: precorrin-4 C(11)-methyltransferase [Syntrophorhabdales bacterium]|jgi:precorrin-4/cobalt-precorrin-4 C11-methyltransferase